MIKCLLWDFGDTLCDELTLWKGSAEWMAMYHSFFDKDGLGAAWSLGRLDAEQVASRLTSQLGLTPSQILSHFIRAELFEFFPRTYEYFCGQHLPQAIVTVNPALFRDWAGSWASTLSSRRWSSRVTIMRRISASGSLVADRATSTGTTRRFSRRQRRTGRAATHNEGLTRHLVLRHEMEEAGMLACASKATYVE